MKLNKPSRLSKLAAALALSFAAVGTAQAAATIVINNLNGPGVGFNDPTPATPVGVHDAAAGAGSISPR